MERHFSAVATALTAASFAVSAVVAAAGSGAPAELEIAELRGRIVCLEKESELQGEDAPCNQLGALFAFRPDDGELLYLLDGDPRAEMFIDPRIRHQPLQIRGWHRPGQRFELLAVHTEKDGVLHHVHYRCDVCDITATAPGPCWCCGQEFELREVKVAGDGGP